MRGFSVSKGIPPRVRAQETKGEISLRCRLCVVQFIVYRMIARQQAGGMTQRQCTHSPGTHAAMLGYHATLYHSLDCEHVPDTCA